MPLPRLEFEGGESERPLLISSPKINCAMNLMSGELPVHNPCMYFTVTKDLANKSHRTLFGSATGVQMAVW